MITRILVVTVLPVLAICLPLNYTQSSNNLNYSDPFARQLIKIAAAAYSTDPRACLFNAGKQMQLPLQLYRNRNVKCDQMKDGCAGFTAVAPSEKALIISFRGTNVPTQLILELQNTLLRKKVMFTGGGSVDAYFYEAFMAVWNGGMKEDFFKLKQQNPGYELWITGHSLGAAMATLCASYIQANGLYDANKIKLLTFGQPRVGDKAFAAAHDKNIPYSFRITHSHDPVVRLPPENIPFVMHYRHHKDEIFYKHSSMSKADFVTCNEDESNDCSDGILIPGNIEDHLWYFQANIPVYAACGCKKC